ncbi:MAG: exo-alpha-sialidase [Bacteroidales bacterium]|nr:exo-alpha-sialidase [Bacteroidales bacterium]
MKKWLYILPILAMAACGRQAEMDVVQQPVTQPVEEPQPGNQPGPEAPVTAEHASLTAYIDNGTLSGESAPATKTGYTIQDGKAVFQWVSGDQIDLVMKQTLEGTSYYTPVRFTAPEGGLEVDFADGAQEGDATVADGGQATGMAFYPSRQSSQAAAENSDLSWEISAAGEVSVTIQPQLWPATDNPLATVPLMGERAESGKYIFRPMTAVLGIPVSGLSTSVDAIRIQSPDVALSGVFAVENGVLTHAGKRYGYTEGLTIHFEATTGDRTFYFPVPAGDIPAGLTISLGRFDTDSQTLTVLHQVTTKKAITLPARTINMTKVLAYDAASQWDAVGQGTFKDDFIWSKAGWSAPVAVSVEQNRENPRQYRLANPYVLAAGGTPTDYFTFTVQSNHQVQFETLNTRYVDSGHELEVRYGTVASADFVAAYQYDGALGKVELQANYVAADLDSYRYTKDGTYSNTERIRLSLAPQGEWNALVGTGTYKDDFIFQEKHSLGADQYVDVAVWQHATDATLYRVENPYPKLAAKLGMTIGTAVTTKPAEYLYFRVENGLVRFDELHAGIDVDEKDYVLCHPDTWKAINGVERTGTYNKVLSARADGVPVQLQLAPIYHEAGNYLEGTGSHMYPRNNKDKLIVLNFPTVTETWTNLGTGRVIDTFLWDKNNFPYYGVPVTIEQSNLGRYRVANPYQVAATLFRGEGAFTWADGDPYLYLTVKGKDVYFEPFKLGMYPKGYASWTTMLAHPDDWPAISNKTMTGTNKLVATRPDGTPGEIQLAGAYYQSPFTSGQYFTNNTGPLRILFPDYTPAEVWYPFGTADYKDNLYCQKIKEQTVWSQTVPVEVSSEDGMRYRIPNPYRHLAEATRVGDEYLYFRASANTRIYFEPFRPGIPFHNGELIIEHPADRNVSHPSENRDKNSNAVITWSSDQSYPATLRMGAVYYDSSDPGYLYSSDWASYTKDSQINIALTPGSYAQAAVDVFTAGSGAYHYRIPGLARTKAGTLIAVADARNAAAGDLPADIDVVVKRSTDGGATWGSAITAMEMGEYGGLSQAKNGIGDACILVDEVTGDIMLFAVWVHALTGLAWNNAGSGYDLDKTPQLMMVRSKDDGLTWSEPVNLTRQVKQPHWKMTFQGPGRGITMADGTLVIPFQHQEPDRTPYSSIMYSTDHGLSWHVNDSPKAQTSEAQVAEVAPGTLLLTMRDESVSGTRAFYTTSDLGRTWQRHAADGQIPDPVCEASLLHIRAADNALGKDILLLSNCGGSIKDQRHHLTIRASLDGGQTWPWNFLVDAGAGYGYSCLSQVDAQTVGILYDKGGAAGTQAFMAIPLTSLVRE